MDITWYGHSCFRMMERGKVSIVTDPFDGNTGYGVPNLRADIVTVSNETPEHNTVDIVKKVQYILAYPGEYEIGGVFITGVETRHPQPPQAEPIRNIIFVFDFGNYTVCHLGSLDYVPEQQQIESLGPIDVLMVPVGGGRALTSGQAVEVISLIEPSVVIPMHYKTAASKQALDPLDKFLKEMGITQVEEQDTLRISSSLLSEETSVVVLRYAQE